MIRLAALSAAVYTLVYFCYSHQTPSSDKVGMNPTTVATNPFTAFRCSYEVGNRASITRWCPWSSIDFQYGGQGETAGALVSHGGVSLLSLIDCQW